MWCDEGDIVESVCLYVYDAVVGEQRLELAPHALEDPKVDELITVSGCSYAMKGCGYWSMLYVCRHCCSG